jgi:hypothetical protein
MFLMFVGLRLAEIITWSWWWVTAPLWGTLLLAFLYAFAKSYRHQARREIWKKMKAERAEVKPINGSE